MSEKPPKEAVTVPADIQSRLEAAGLRRTLATRAVLGLFLSRPLASLSHAQAQAALSARGLAINRVTLYRLLDRLAACGVLQRHTDDQRTWRFQLAPPAGEAVPAATARPRFECDACHRQIPLLGPDAPTRAATQDLMQALARLGHAGARVDLAVHGTCASCAETGTPPSDRAPNA